MRRTKKKMKEANKLRANEDHTRTLSPISEEGKNVTKKYLWGKKLFFSSNTAKKLFSHSKLTRRIIFVKRTKNKFAPLPNNKKKAVLNAIFHPSINECMMPPASTLVICTDGRESDMHAVRQKIEALQARQKRSNLHGLEVQAGRSRRKMACGFLL